MVDAARSQIRDFAGHETVSCPWRAFTSWLVRDVLQGMRYFESGNLHLAFPQPSHRLVEGIGFWSATMNRIQSKQLELDKKNRENAAPPQTGRR